MFDNLYISLLFILGFFTSSCSLHESNLKAHVSWPAVRFLVALLSGPRALESLWPLDS